jgi:transposase
MKAESQEEFAALIGLDWADRRHAVCLQVTGKPTLEFTTVVHKPEALDAWATALRQRFAGRPVAVCLELRKGPLVYALAKYDFLILFPIHPQTVARYRRAFTPSRAKDDPSDAEVLLDLLARHRDKLPAWTPASPQLRALQQLVEMRRKLVGDKVRLTNRLTAALKNYYPQVLEWFAEKDTAIFCDFLTQWPTLAAAQQAPDTALITFFHAHNARYRKVTDHRLAQIRTAQPLTADPGVVGPHQLLVTTLVQQLKVVLDGLKQFDAAIAELFAQHRDAALFLSLPGAGKQYAPRLLVAFGEDRTHYADAADLLQYAGIAPVTERSGQSTWVHWRYSCPKFLRQSFVEWAAESIRHSFWASAFYHSQRAKGKSHQMAVRAVAFKWVRIVFRCWQTRKPYDEAKYLLALKAKGSPLLTASAPASS